MKKRYLAIAGLLVLAVAAAGCGKEKDKPAEQQVQATPTVTPQVTEAADLVDMEVSDEKNVIGEKSTTASKVAIINRTGSEIGAIYIRQHPQDEEETDDDEWGDDLVDGMFTLKNGEQAVYYYKKPSSAGITYDIRITYTDEDKNECFFRDLPLASMKQITLRMSGTGEDSIPYATYMTATGKKEISTLTDVKERLGLTEDEDDDDTENPEPTSAPEPTDAPEPTSAPEPTDTPDDPDYDPDDTQPTDDTIDKATGYIGQSMDDLIAAIGSPQYDEYEDEPDTGKTGYHYYSNFTVSTTVDEDGNEIVTGIW